MSSNRAYVVVLGIEGSEYPAVQGTAKQLGAPGTPRPAAVSGVHRHYADWAGGLENPDIGRMPQGCGHMVLAVRDCHGNQPMGDTPSSWSRSPPTSTARCTA